MLGNLFGPPKRRTGWHASPASTLDHPFERMGLSARELPALVDNLQLYWLRHFDQGSTSSCTGNAASAAIAMGARWNLHDKEVPVPSRQALYYGGRALTAAKFGGAPISDDGAYLRDVFDAARRLGVPFESDAPFDPWHINRPAPFGAMVLGHGHRGGSYVRIQESGSQKSLAVRTAIAAGHAVVIGSPITEEYTRDGDSHVFDRPSVTEPIAGGHAQVLSGYVPDVTHGRLYRVVNSWGDQWRAGGDAWLSERFVEWAALEAWVVYGFEVRQ